MENLYNKYLKIRAWLYSKRPFSTRVREVLPPNNYTLTLYDNFQNGLSSDKWRIGHPWGRFFRHRLGFYWDEIAVRTGTQGLYLDVIKTPKRFIKKELPKWEQHQSLPEEWVAHYAVGKISSTQTFTHNTWISVKAILSKNMYQWSAFWTCGYKTWPPEIDIFEAFTESNNNYEVSPNIHWGKDINGEHPNLGYLPIPLMNPRREIQYVVHWTDKFVKIYYDGILVKVLKDAKMLEDLKKEQYIILNNGIQDEKVIPLREILDVSSPMIITEIKVYKL